LFRALQRARVERALLRCSAYALFTFAFVAAPSSPGLTEPREPPHQALSAASKPPVPGRRPTPVVEARPIIDGGIQVREERGLATLVGAFELASSDPEFGGLSGLVIEGDTMLAVSDHGSIWRARLESDSSGRLLGLTEWDVAALGLPGVTRRPALDIEALARRRDGYLIASLEQHRELLVIDPATFASVGLQDLPLALAAGPRNEGVEALASMPNGDLLAISEATHGKGLAAMARLVDGESSEGSFLPVEGFQATDATAFGERLYVLQRSATLLGGLRAVVTATNLSELGKGAPDRPLRGEVVARIDATFIGANFEGIAAARAPDGGIFIYTVADDNFSALLPTLLLQLKLPPSLDAG
jgi:hypothetical protein